MRWDASLDPASNESVLNKAAQKPAPTVIPNPQFATNLSRVKQRAGWLSPEVQVALAKANASDAAIDAAGKLKAKQIAEAQVSPVGKSIKDQIYDNVKAGSRWATAALNFVPEYGQGAIAQLFDKNDDVDGWFISTTLGSMIENPELRGEGFFASQALMEKQAERARRYRGTVNGSGWSVGRGSANLVFQPNTKPYNIMSGVLDALFLLKVDPTGPVTKAVKAFNRTRNMVPLLSKADVSPLRLALETEAGITHNLLGASVSGQKFLRFWDDNVRASQLVDELVEEESVLKVWEKFDGELDNDVVVRLAGAKSREEVVNVLAEGWVTEAGALRADIREYQAIERFGLGAARRGLGEVVEKMPLVDSVRKSRWFQTLPEREIIFNGTADDQRKSMRNFIQYLRLSNMPEQELEQFAEVAFKAFGTEGTAAQKKAVVDVFNAAVKSALMRNGMDDDSATLLIRRAQDGIRQVRRFMMDRQANPTDGGMFRFIANQNHDYLPQEELDNMLEIFGGSEIGQIQGPLQIVELLDRVLILPDPREIRRATSNPWLSKLTTARAASKRSMREVRRLKSGMKDAYEEAQRELADIATRFPSGGRMPDDVAARVVELNETLADSFETVKRRVNVGEQRAAVEALDLIQNRLWKPLALATGGYVFRNTLDAQIRMAMAGLNSALSHPFEYIALVLGHSQRRSIMGESLLGYKSLDEIWEGMRQGLSLEEITKTNLTEFEKDLRTGLSFNMRQQGLVDPVDGSATLLKTNEWNEASRGMPNGVELHTDGVVDSGYLIHADDLQKIAAQGLAIGQDRRLIVARIVERIKKDKRLFAEVEDIYYRGGQGRVVSNPDGVKATVQRMPRLRDLSAEELDRFLREHAELVVLGNVETQTGNIPDMQFMAAFNEIPETKFQNGRYVRVAPVELEASTLRPVNPDETPRVGTLVQIGEDKVGVVTQLKDKEQLRVIDPFTDQEIVLSDTFATVVPVTGEKAFGNIDQVVNKVAFDGKILRGASKARRMIENMPLWDETQRVGLPQRVKRELYRVEATNKGGVLQHSAQAMDKFTNFYFGELYALASKVLDRSPTFRQYYFQTILEQADLLSPEAAQAVLDDIAERAAALNLTPEEFLGETRIVGRNLKGSPTLRALKASTMTPGTATAAELDEYARFVALQKTRELLYDASNRTNLEDALRIIMPFAPAWREVIMTYAAFAKGNPVGTGRAFQRLWSGATGSDPDNDGRGMFYKDPNTGQMMFMFPGSGTLAKILTGVNAPLEAPVKRFSQGINAYPSLGPMMQVAASWLPDAPVLDGVKEFLLPYGEKTIGSAFNPTPQWADKFIQAIRADTGKLDNVFGNTYVETLRALSASGKYDLDDQNSVNQLYKDAEGKARVLTMLRAASQFLGPTSGATEFKIPTKQGDQFVSALVKEFYDLQAKDYDTAVPKFLELYGEEVMLYISSKTKSVREGLEATQEFSVWERTNQDLLADYADVAAYMAPAGSEFNFTVWQRQLQSGERVRLTDREIVAEAQRRIGSAKYRAARRLIGPYPNETQKTVLRQYRELLHRQYPGFPLKAEFTVGKFDNDIEQLQNMVNDPRLADNQIAKTAAEYLGLRNQAIAAYVAQGGQPGGFGQAKAAAGLRDALASIGDTLAQREPGFSRLWQRLLAQEVEE